MFDPRRQLIASDVIRPEHPCVGPLWRRRTLGAIEHQPYRGPFRTVPVRLGHGHRSRRTAVFGLRPRRTRELALLLDIDEREHEIPADGGVLVSAKLAEVLGVRPGDRMTAEVLEGEHRVRELPVVATVKDVSGINATHDGAARRQSAGGGARRRIRMRHGRDYGRVMEPLIPIAMVALLGSMPALAAGCASLRRSVCG